MDAKQKLEMLRSRMAVERIHGYVQPVHDEYMNEYPPECAQRVKWLCGFAGSAGTVAVLEKEAAIFVDGRYLLQAKSEVEGKLYEQHNIETLRADQWLAERAKSSWRIGYDPKLFTRDMVKRYEAALKKNNAVFVPISNLIDALWRDRPAVPQSRVMVHSLYYSGETSEKKRRRIAESIKKSGADVVVIAAPDSLCWLLNIRASDVEGAPLLLASALLDSSGKVQLFVDPRRCGPEVKQHLGADVMLREPSLLEVALDAKGKEGARVLCDPQTLPVWYTQILSRAGAHIVDGGDPCTLPKAMKNKTEIEGMKTAHIRDGVAVTKFLCWLDKQTAKRQVMELECCEKLLGFRSLSPLFMGPSFNTISGSGPHGAIVHYRASEKTNRALKKGELFLLDSGGQYPDGTTDITRTIAIGAPNKEHKDRFTRVLKGHIALARAQFPEGTSGSQLDALARQYLWAGGFDFDHGTGHGVGHFLNVHEGPQRIGKRGGDAPLRPGMVVSNEPGYYKPGAYGIRIESLVTVVDIGKSEGRHYYGFETLTYAPIDTRAIEKTLMTQAERKWLNAYHRFVLKQLSPHLDKAEKLWLKKHCKAI
jgi:Xaa-Pro aminopeptidase